jgi:hypothetical protein
MTVKLQPSRFICCDFSYYLPTTTTTTTTTKPTKQKKPTIHNKLQQNRKCIFICATIALIFAYASVLTCDFLKVGEEGLKYMDLESRGPFFEASYNANHTKLGCVRYDPSVEMSMPLKWSQVGGGALLPMITICWFMVIPWFLFSSNEITKKFLHLMLRICFPICLAINAFVLTKMYGIPECSMDGYKCAPGIAAILAVINTFILIYLSIMICLIPIPAQPVLLFNENLPKKPEPNSNNNNRFMEEPPPKKGKKKKNNNDNDTTNNADNDDPHADDVVETTIEVLPTGTKKTHYITHPDGTQSVKEEFLPKANEIV